MTENSSSSVIQSELWKKNLDAIGLRADFVVSNFADNLKAAMQCKYMIWGGAWIADYPEGENFAQLGPIRLRAISVATSPKPMMHFIHKQWPTTASAFAIL
jgi:hypothetical protein